jgi:hypothetical protein
VEWRRSKSAFAHVNVMAAMVSNLAHPTPRLRTSMKTGRSDQELDAGFK